MTRRTSRPQALGPARCSGRAGCACGHAAGALPAPCSPPPPAASHRAGLALCLCALVPSCPCPACLCSRNSTPGSRCSCPLPRTRDTVSGCYPELDRRLTPGLVLSCPASHLTAPLPTLLPAHPTLPIHRTHPRTATLCDLDSSRRYLSWPRSLDWDSEGRSSLCRTTPASPSMGLIPCPLPETSLCSSWQPQTVLAFS